MPTTQIHVFEHLFEIFVSVCLFEGGCPAWVCRDVGCCVLGGGVDVKICSKA